MFCFVGVTAALYLVLAEEEGQQHQHASIVDDPPHIDVALSEALSVGREGRDVLGHEQSQVSCGGFSDQLCRRGRGVSQAVSANRPVAMTVLRARSLYIRHTPTQ